MAKIIITQEVTTPATPPAGTLVIYTKPDRVLYMLDEFGVETPLTNIVEDTILYFEGDFPPDFVNIDDYNFSDGAAFSPGVDEDIIFRVTPVREYQKGGVRLLLRYCMSTSDTGTLRFRFDYRVKEIGDPATGGTNYQQFVTFDPVETAEVLGVFSDLIIPATRITGNTELVYCRLSRLGADVADTHTGDFCLVGMGTVKL